LENSAKFTKKEKGKDSKVGKGSANVARGNRILQGSMCRGYTSQKGRTRKFEKARVQKGIGTGKGGG